MNRLCLFCRWRGLWTADNLATTPRGKRDLRSRSFTSALVGRTSNSAIPLTTQREADTNGTTEATNPCGKLENSQAAHPLLSELSAMLSRGHIASGLALYRKLRGSPETALQLFRSRELLHQLLACTRVTELPKINKPRTIIRIYRDMRAHGVLLSRSDYNSLIHAHLGLGDTKTVLALFVEMRARSLPPTVSLYNLMLSYFVRQGNTESALAGLVQMKKANIRPNVRSYNIVLAAIANQDAPDSIQEMLKLLDAMEAEGVEPDIVTFNTLSQGYIRKGDVENAMHLLGNMLGHGITPDEVTYRSIIVGLLRSKEIKRAEMHFRAMVQAGHPAPAWLYGKFVIACAKEGFVDDATRWFTDMTSDGSTPASDVIQTMIRCRAIQGDMGGTSEWLQIMWKHYPDEQTPGTVYRVVMRELLTHRRNDLLPIMHRLILDAGFTVDATIESKWRKLDGPHSMDAGTVSKESIESDLDIVSLNRHIAAYARDPSTLHQAIQLLKSLGRRQLKPTAASYSPILAAYGRASDINSVKAYWSQMVDGGVKPDVACWNALVQAKLRAGQSGNALDSLEETRIVGIEPNGVTVRLEIEASLSRGLFSEAADMVDRVCRKRIADAYVVIDGAIRSLCQAARVDLAFSCWKLSIAVKKDALEAKNMKSVISPATSMHLVRALIESNKKNELVEVYEVLEDDAMLVDPVTMESMVRFFLANPDHTLAMNVVERGVWQQVRRTPPLDWHLIFRFLLILDSGDLYKLLTQVLKEAAEPPTQASLQAMFREMLKRRDINGAVDLYRLYANSGLKLPCESYEMILGSQEMHWPRPFLTQCIKDLVRLSDATWARALYRGLEQAITLGDADVVWSIFRAIRDQSLSLTRTQSARILRVLSRQTGSDRVEEVLGTIADVDRDVSIYESVATVYARSGDSDKVFNALRNMQLCNREVEKGCYLPLVRIALAALESKHFEIGMAVLSWMTDYGLSISTRTWTEALAIVCKMGDVGRASDIMSTVIISGSHPTQAMTDLLVKGYVQVDRTEEAVLLLESTQADLAPSMAAFNEVLAALQKQSAEDFDPVVQARSFDLISRVFTRMKALGYQPDIVTYTCMLATAETIQRIEAIQQDVDKIGQSADAIWLLSLANAYARLGHPRKCEELVKAIPGPMDTRKFNVLINARKRLGDYYGALQCFHNMQSAEVPADIATFNTLLAALINSTQVPSKEDECLVLLELCRKSGITWTHHTWNLLITLQGAEKGGLAALRQMRKMHSAGIQPDVNSVISLLRSLSLRNNSQWAAWTVEKLMGHFNLKRTQAVHEAVVAGFAQTGRAHLIRKWLSLYEEIYRTPRIWRSLVTAHAMAGDIDGAAGVVVEHNKHMRSAHLQSHGHFGVGRKSRRFRQPRSTGKAWRDIHAMHIVANAYAESGQFHRSLDRLRDIPNDSRDGVTCGILFKIFLRARWMKWAEWTWNELIQRTDHDSHMSPSLPAPKRLYMKPSTRKVFRRRHLRPSAAASLDRSLATRLKVLIRPLGRRHLTESATCQYLDLHGLEPKSNGSALTVLWQQILTFGEPTENMCNSFMEALCRKGHVQQAVKVFAMMDGNGLRPRPTPKTIRTLVGGIIGAGKVSMIGKAKSIAERRWPMLAPVVDSVVKLNEMK
ncbi:hypothetical protein BC832DRAFT_95191 [Gaertneriomyces semiglobifer]|nr:hypothetical protein BC832DRAFT_95191 [Gaertneriomyces semiglobifer]